MAYPQFDTYFELYHPGGQGGYWMRKKQRTQILEMRYGDRLITDSGVLKIFYDAICGNMVMRINNTVLDCDGPKDPKPGVVKEFLIRYTTTGNHRHDYIKTRRCSETGKIDFGWDIIGLTFGLSNATWDVGGRFPSALEKCFQALDTCTPFVPNTTNMCCDPYGGGKNVMICTYVYRSRSSQPIVAEVKEGENANLGNIAWGF